MPDPVRLTVRTSLLMAICAGLVGCGSFDGASSRIAGLVTPYRIDIVQGNFVSSEQIALLKPGMARQQVRDVLGTPLLQSVFHSNRWDYIFTFQRKGEEPQLRKVTVYFNDTGLERFDADPLPSEAEFVASLSKGRKATGAIPSLEASEDALKKFPAAAKAPEAKPIPPLPATYPPLETSTP
ncbi:MAG: outer membrane protein assembly factor BamE [Rhodoferax sp.]|jgi:outer membrane protein assembly factor BamE|nr:outer membrane protein assembly factor BamE [Rhodoferax sp.]